MSDIDRELDELAHDLVRFGSVTAPAKLRARIRSEIMAAPVVTARPARRSWLAALRPVIAAVLIVAVLAAGAGTAAAGSLPGDPAFPIKRAAEDAQVALAADDVARLDLLTHQLDRRLTDLETVAAQRPGTVSAAIAEYQAALARVESELAIVEKAAGSAARDAAIARASAAADTHLARLRALEEKLPAAAQGGIERAIDAQQRIHGRGDGQPASPSDGDGPGRPSSGPGSRPGNVPGSQPGNAPGGAPKTDPGSAPSTRPTPPPARTDRPTPTHR